MNFQFSIKKDAMNRIPTNFQFSIFNFSIHPHPRIQYAVNNINNNIDYY